ncbi:MAG: glycosyltransferase, partial [Litorimonas sp.]
KAKNAFMVPHGSFPTDIEGTPPRLNERSNIIVTMGKFGTYKRLERTIGAVQNLNTRRGDDKKLKLIIGGTDHPAKAGYLEQLAVKHNCDANIIFHGYVAEEDVAGFFTQAKLAIFDYDSTTGSSGVLHQAAIYGTPAAYPMMGDFIDVSEREGLQGFNFKALDQSTLEQAILDCFNAPNRAQIIAEDNLAVSKGVTMDTVVSIQFQLLKQVKVKKFYELRQAKHAALKIQQTR